MGQTLRFREVKNDESFKGHWLLLDQYRLDEHSAVPVDARVLDADVDLSRLYARMRAQGQRNCAVVFFDRLRAPRDSYPPRQ